MIRLIESGLFGNKLIPVKSELMVSRYNACLSDLGISTTKLKSFHIDGWGWSPEIAEEKNNHFYLTHGYANSYGIIISPDQKNGPIYMPYHSFDWEVHKEIFDNWLDQIEDITTGSGLWFALNQEFSAFQSPEDLLMVDAVQVNFTAVDRIIQAARKQRKLIRKFNETAFSWMNKELRNQIIESSEIHGDLRYRKIDIKPIPFNDFNSFFTLAFQGIFVIKDDSISKPILIYYNNSSENSGVDEFTHIEFNINDPKLIDYLKKQLLIKKHEPFLRNNTFLIHQKISSLIMHGLLKCKSIPDTTDANENVKRNILVNYLKHKNKLPEAFFVYEKILKRLKNGELIRMDEFKSANENAVLHPRENLAKSTKLILWQILSYHNSDNPVLQYLFDKSRFYKEYKKWPEAKQQWAVDLILEEKGYFNNLIY